MEREEDRIKKAEALLKKCNALLLKAGTYAGRVNLLEAIYDQGGHCRRDEIVGMQKQIESYRGYTLTLLHRIHTNPTGALQDDICRMATQLALYLHNELSDYHVRLKEIQKELGKAG